MAEPPSKQKPEIEIVPDAWPRFERFISDVAKAGPQHRTSLKPHKKAVGKIVPLKRRESKKEHDDDA